MPSATSTFHKDSQELARAVRALGLKVESNSHSHFVRDDEGNLLAVFPAHPSHRNWRGQALSALRKANIVVGGDGRLSMEVTPEDNAELMRRLAPLADDDDARREFISAAVAAIDEAHERGEFMDVQQFGSTPGAKSKPEEIARESLRQILQKGGTKKARAFNRWQSILQLLDSRASATNGNGATSEPGPEAEAEPEPGPTAEEVEAGLLKRIADLEGEARSAEQLMHEADENRKKEKERADRLESQNRVLKERVEKAEAAATEIQSSVEGLRKSEANARRSASRQKSEVRKMRERFDEMDAAARESVEQAQRETRQAQLARSSVEGQLLEIRESLGRVEGSEGKSALEIIDGLLAEPEAEPERAGFRDELGAYLMQLLGTTEYAESPPQWLLDRVDRLAGL
jgi:hypothetical protein